MTVLKNLSQAAPFTEPIIRCYECGRIVLNAAARDLLLLDEESQIAFKVGAEGEGVDARRVFIGKTKCGGFPFKSRNRCCMVSSTRLARDFSAAMQGYGTYRIERDYIIYDFNNQPYYSIFFRKYEKDNGK